MTPVLFGVSFGFSWLSVRYKYSPNFLRYFLRTLEVRMTSRKRTARIAGLWYLGFTLGPFYLLYVPSQTVVHNDAASTAARVLSHETLYRWGMLAETLGAVIFIGLSLALYRLFEDVDRHRARQLVALVLVSSALGLVAVVFSAAALLVFQGGAAFARLRRSHARRYRHAPDQHAWAGERHQPDVLGIVAVAFWMAWSCARASCRAGSATGSCLTASPGWSSASPGSSLRITLTLSSATSSRVFLAELAAMLWLLIMGAKEQPLVAAATT